MNYDSFLKATPVVKKTLSSANDYTSSKGAVLRYVMEDMQIEHGTDNLLLEFGVGRGTSINFIASYTDGIVHGFDSFQGLPEDWNAAHKRGHFSLNRKLPKIRNNVHLIPAMNSSSPTQGTAISGARRAGTVS